MHPIRAAARFSRAIDATAELLTKLRVEAMFVGSVARAAWLGGEVDSGSIDVLALMNAPQKGQLAMMASHRGYRVEREEIEQSEELDLVPLNFVDSEGDVRVHVLLATNALYGRMLGNATAAEGGGATPIRVASAEDLALLSLMADDEVTVRRLQSLAEFDREAFDERLASIGLGGRVAAQ